jgi:hypothetical protein
MFHPKTLLETMDPHKQHNLPAVWVKLDNGSVKDVPGRPTRFILLMVSPHMQLELYVLLFSLASN